MGELADQLDAAGLRPIGTSVLNDRREFVLLMNQAMQRLAANDNQPNQPGKNT